MTLYEQSVMKKIVEKIFNLKWKSDQWCMVKWWCWRWTGTLTCHAFHIPRNGGHIRNTYSDKDVICYYCLWSVLPTPCCRAGNRKRR